MTTKFILLVTIALLAGACAQIPPTTEKSVILEVPQNFRGPIMFSLDANRGEAPRVVGGDLVYRIPESGKLEIRGVGPDDINRGARWDHCFIRYPNEKIVRSYGNGDRIEESRDYLFAIGRHSFRGVNRVLFLVCTPTQRLEVQARPYGDIEEVFYIWKQIAEKSNQPPQTTPGSSAPLRV